MDWGTIIFAVLALAFVVLIIQAIRQMSAPIEAPAEAEAGPAEAEAGPVEAEAGPAEAEPAPAPEPKKRVRDTEEEKKRLKKGLAKTRGGFISRLGSLFKGKRELDETLLDEIEEILFTADIGVRTSQELIDSIRAHLGKQEIGDPDAIWAHIRARSAEILASHSDERFDVSGHRPFVVLFVGVNGTGKTTTIGKVATLLAEEGRRVLLAAGDTFRAAAVEQLAIWGERAGCEVVQGKEGADPTSVMVEALKRARDEGHDVVLADTAGRLHTKADLMDELQKVGRSMAKWIDGAPHETLLVLDATTGQNAIAQAQLFKEAMNITGLILTKLDGTAKGGVVLGICNELKLPVRFVGIGEKKEDLREFDPEAFIAALYEGADVAPGQG